MNQWIFLRHGESEANKARVFSGHQDVALTALGRDQAIAAGIEIRKLLGSTVLSAVWSSDLKRARHTAQLALSAAQMNCPVQEHAALRERHLGEWQGESIDRLKQSGAREALATWTGAAPGGESLAQLCARAVPLLATLHTQGPTLLVGHGGLIRGLLGLLDDSAKKEIGKRHVPNAVPIVRWIESGRWNQILQGLGG